MLKPVPNLNTLLLPMPYCPAENHHWQSPHCFLYEMSRAIDKKHVMLFKTLKNEKIETQ